jgi:hypothetical protein
MPVFPHVNASGFTAGRQGFLCDTPGGGLRIVTGVNTRLVRTAALVAGTLLVANNSVTAATRFFLNHVGSAAGNMGALYVSAIVAGVSFTITSNNGADTDTIDVLMVESA